jgi:hypothetical protein
MLSSHSAAKAAFKHTISIPVLTLHLPVMPPTAAQTIYELLQDRKNAVLAFLKEWQSHFLGMT